MSSWTCQRVLSVDRRGPTPSLGPVACRSLISHLVQAELLSDPGHAPGQSDPERIGTAAELGGDLRPGRPLCAAIEEVAFVGRQATPSLLQQLPGRDLPARAG